MCHAIQKFGEPHITCFSCIAREEQGKKGITCRKCNVGVWSLDGDYKNMGGHCTNCYYK